MKILKLNGIEKYMAYLIAGYINSFRFSITIILTALYRTKKGTNGSYKYNPTNNPIIIIEQRFISINLSVLYLNLLTFLLRINEFVKVCAYYICLLYTSSNPYKTENLIKVEQNIRCLKIYLIL
jgi:hypothetical protein